MKLNIGDKAPLFRGKDQDGKDVNLKDYTGKKVVLYFYPNDDTPGCTAQACNIRDNYDRLISKGYKVFGISGNDEASHRKFIAKYKLPFSLIADTDKSINELYGVWVEKSMYGKSFMGTARTTFIIDEKGIISDIIAKVVTDNHTEQILNPGVEIKKVKRPAVPNKAKETKAPAAKKTAEKKTPVKKKPAAATKAKAPVKKVVSKKKK